VNGFLEDLGRRRFPEVARRLGVSVEQVQRQPISSPLSIPKPGQIFSGSNSYVLPDVSVDKVDDGYSVTLNGDQIPPLADQHLQRPDDQGGNGADVATTSARRSEAENLLIRVFITAADLLNIANEIVNGSTNFLELGTGS